MGKDMTRIFCDEEPIENYRLLSVFQRKLQKKPPEIRRALTSMAKCCKAIIPLNHGGMVSVVGARRLQRINRGRVFNSASFHGTCKCHNLWACPVCAARRMTQYSYALTSYLESISKTAAAFMVTYTVPHNRYETAEEVLKKLQQVRRQSLHGAPERFQKNVLQTISTVTSYEVTYTKWAGWHVHVHQLYVIPRTNWQHVEAFYQLVLAGTRRAIMTLCGFDIMDGKTRQQAVWLSRKSNGKPLQITSGKYILGYGRELTKSIQGKKAPGDLRRSATLFELIDASDEDFDTLCDFLLASRNKVRIRCSAGLRATLEKFMAEKKIADSTRIETAVVGSFSAPQWHEILVAEFVTGINLRYEILKAALDGYYPLAQFCFRLSLPIPFPPSTKKFSNQRYTEDETSRSLITA